MLVTYAGAPQPRGLLHSRPAADTHVTATVAMPALPRNTNRLLAAPQQVAPTKKNLKIPPQKERSVAVPDDVTRNTNRLLERQRDRETERERAAREREADSSSSNH